MQQIISELKSLLASGINLGGLDIGRVRADEPLFSKQGLGLDSIDAMELCLLLQKRFGIALETIQHGREAFNTLTTLAEFVENNRTR